MVLLVSHLVRKGSINVVADASTKTDQGSGQAFLVGETITESDVGLYDRIIRADVTAHGHKVVKGRDISSLCTP